MTPLRHKMIRDLTIRGRAEATIREYTRLVEKLAEYYRRSPDQISSEQVQDYLFYLATERGYAEKSINVVVSALRFFYHVTLRRASTSFVIPATKEPKKLPVVFSREEIEQLFSATTNLRDLALLMVAYSNGLRISEAVSLRIADIDSSRMAIHIHAGKGLKDRMGGLSVRLQQTLREYWLAYRPNVWLFPSRMYPGRHLTAATARQIFHRTRIRAGINKPARFHTLRHSCATHLLEAGKDIREIQRLLGHESLSSTFVYIHIAQGVLFQFDSPLDLPPASKT